MYVRRLSLDYVRMLLAYPFIDVNLCDEENHWTVLHRALYAGNIEAAWVSCFALYR